jgi:hypothetical protein
MLPHLSTNMVVANCLVCISRSYFDRFLVLYQIKGFCQHSQSSFSSSPTFRVSKIAVIFNLLVVISMVFPAVSYLQSLKMVCSATRSLCLILMADQIYVISSIVLETLIAVKIETIHQDTLSWLHIFENRRFYNIGNIFDEQKLKKFVAARSVSILMSLCVSIMTQIYLFSNHTYYDSLSWSYERKISMMVASIIQSFVFVEVFHKIFIMGALLEAAKTALRKTYFNKNFNIFKKQVHLIAAINDCSKLTMNLTTLLLIVWILTTIILLIFNVYALTDYASYNSLTIMVMHGKTIFFMMGCASFLHVHDENLKRKVSLFLLSLC